MADRTARQIELERVSRLHGAFRVPIGKAGRAEGEAPYVRGQLTFVVGTGRDPDRPVFYLETLNLVFDPADALGGGTANPSASLPGDSNPPVEFDPKSKEIFTEFDIDIDFPGARREGAQEFDPSDDTPGPKAIRSRAELRCRFLSDLRPVAYRYETLEARLSIQVPEIFIERLGVPPLLEFVAVIPVFWIFFRPRKQLCIQPVFIAPEGSTPATGSDFYPLLARANEIWAKCCIQFVANCPPIYVDNQDYRISTTAEASAFKDEIDVDGAIEVFVVERLDPEDAWGGGATFGSGTAAAKIVTGDNQLPLNQNHLAHELGHVLGLGHPGNATDGLIDGCVGSVMEPSGFFADNPESQCASNCLNASNPLLCTVPHQRCTKWTMEPAIALAELVANVALI